MGYEYFFNAKGLSAYVTFFFFEKKEWEKSIEYFEMI